MPSGRHNGDSLKDVRNDPWEMILFVLARDTEGTNNTFLHFTFTQGLSENVQMCMSLFQLINTSNCFIWWLVNVFLFHHIEYIMAICRQREYLRSHCFHLFWGWGIECILSSTNSKRKTIQKNLECQSVQPRLDVCR